MTITIDGKICTCEPGEILYDISARNGINIPTLCLHDGLAGLGSCRVCIVEVEIKNKRSVVASCVYPVENECVVYTDSELIKKQRGMILSLLSAAAPQSDKIRELHTLCTAAGFFHFPGRRRLAWKESCSFD